MTRSIYIFLFLAVVLVSPVLGQTFTVKPPAVLNDDGSAEPQLLFKPGDTVLLKWSKALTNAQLKIGTSSGEYTLQTKGVSGEQTTFSPEALGLSPGVYYAVLTNAASNALAEIEQEAAADQSVEFSQEFALTIEAQTAPTINGPRGTTTKGTPTFDWDAVSGVPAYWVVLSDSPFQLEKNSETGRLEVQGANVIWQIVTSSSSVRYGSANPNDPFKDFEPSPLQPGKEYNFTVLNVYREDNVAYASEVFSSVVAFSYESSETLTAPALVGPDDGKVFYGSGTVTLDWQSVDNANSYTVKVYEEFMQSGSQVKLPVWSTTTSNTLVDFDARANLRRGHYTWSVTALDNSGNGRTSKSQGFDYEVDMGAFRLDSWSNLDQSSIAGVELTVQSVDGGYTPSTKFLAGNSSVIKDSLVVGRYEFSVTHDHYADTSFTVDVSANQQSHLNLYMEPIPSQIVGTVRDQTGKAVSEAAVTLTAVGSGQQTTAETTSNGEFTAGVQPGSYEVEASKEGYLSSQTLSVSVDPNDRASLTEPLKVTYDRATVAGKIANKNGGVVQMATVLATNGQVTQRAISSGTGSYSFTLSSGKWSITAGKNGFVSSSPIVLSLARGDNMQGEDIVLSAGANQVTGTIYRVVPETDGSTSRVPFGGATVTATPSAGSPVSTTADEQGRYALNLRDGSYTVEAKAKNYSPAQATATVEAASVQNAETVGGMDFKLMPNSATIAGVVGRTDGSPLEGVTVSVGGGQKVQTNASGVYTLSVPPATYQVKVEKSGFVAPEPQQVAVGAGGEVTGINFEMAPNAGTIAGTVRSGGEVVSGAAVWAIQNGQKVSTTTDSQGKYTLSVASGSWEVYAVKDGFNQSTSETITVGSGQKSLNNGLLLASNTATIKGTVTDGSAPVRSAQVTIVRSSGADKQATQTRVDGSFSATVSAGSSYRLRVSKPDYQSTSMVSETLAAGATLTPTMVVKPSSSSIAGTVQDGKGQAISNSKVVVMKDEARIDSISTAADGGYSLGLTPGTYRLEVSKSGYTRNTQQVNLEVGQDLSNVNVVLTENFATVSGQLVAQNKEPVEGALVTLLGDGSGATVRSAADGSFLANSLPQGIYSIEVKHSAFADTVLTNISVPGGAATSLGEVALTRLAGQINGQVKVQDSGNPLADATVAALRSGNVQKKVVTDENGRFQLDALPLGEYVIHVSKSGFTSPEPASTHLSDNSTSALVTIDNLVRNTGRVTGVVRDKSGNPLLDVLVSVAGSKGSASTRTSANGTYTLSELAPGTYVFTTSKKGFVGKTDTIAVSGAVTVDPQMALSNGKIAGKVVNQAGKPLSFSVDLTAVSGEIRLTTTTNASGEFTFEGVTPGRSYTVQTDIARSGHENGSVSVTLPPDNSSVSVGSVPVAVNTASITGNVGVSGATVYVMDAATEGIVKTVTADPDGSFEAHFLPNGKYKVVPQKGGFLFSSDNTPVELGIGETGSKEFSASENTATLTLQVQDEQGAPMASVQAKVVSTDTSVVARQQTNASGQAVFKDLEAGKSYILQVVKEAFSTSPADPAQRTVALAPKDSVGQLLTLVANNASIAGEVRTPKGQGLEDAVVVARQVESSKVFRVQTNGQGQYRMEKVSSGTFELIATQSGYRSDTLVVKELRKGQEQSGQNFELVPQNVDLKGRVLFAGGGLGDVSVTATGASRFTAVTDANGRFRFVDLPVKAALTDTTTYELAVSGSNTAMVRRTVEVPGSQMNQTVTLPAFVVPSGQVQLTFTDGVKPLSGLSLMFTHPSGRTVEAVTGSKGRFLSDGTLTKGRYRLSVEKRNYLRPGVNQLKVELPSDSSKAVKTVALPYRHEPLENLSATQDATVRVEFASDYQPVQAAAHLFFKEASANSFKKVAMKQAGAGFIAKLPAQHSMKEVIYHIEVTEGEFSYSTPEQVVKPTAEGLLANVRMSPNLADKSLRKNDRYPVELILRDGVNNPLTNRFKGTDAVGQIEWVSSDPEAIAVTYPKEKDSTHVVLAPRKAGSFSLQVRARLNGAVVTRKVDLQINDQPLEELAVNASSARINNRSEGVQLSPAGQDTTGNQITLGGGLVWSVSPKGAGKVVDGIFTATDTTVIGPVEVAVADTMSGLADTAQISIFASIDQHQSYTLTDKRGMVLKLPGGTVPFPVELGLKRSQTRTVKKQAHPSASNKGYRVADQQYTFTLQANRALPGDSLSADATLALPVGSTSRFFKGEKAVGLFNQEDMQWQIVAQANGPAASNKRTAGKRLTGSSSGAAEENTTDVRTKAFRKAGTYAVLSQSEPLDLRHVAVLPVSFSPTVSPVKIGYFLTSAHPPAEVTLRIYNLQGELVRTLFENEAQEPGRYGSRTSLREITWDGRTNIGTMARNGRYIIEIHAEDSKEEVTKLKQVVLIK